MLAISKNTVYNIHVYFNYMRLYLSINVFIFMQRLCLLLIDIDKIVDEPEIRENEKNDAIKERGELLSTNKLKRRWNMIVEKYDFSIFAKYIASWFVISAFTFLILGTIEAVKHNPTCSGSLLSNANMTYATESVLSGNELLLFMISTSMLMLVEFFSKSTEEFAHLSIIFFALLVYAFGLFVYGIEFVIRVLVINSSDSTYFYDLNYIYGVVWLVFSFLGYLVLSSRQNNESWEEEKC